MVAHARWRRKPTAALTRTAGVRARAGAGDELEAALIAGGEGSSDKLCLELTGICEGIDWKKPNVAGYEGYVPPDPRPDPDLQKKKKSGKKGKKKQHGTAGDPAPSGNEKEEL